MSRDSGDLSDELLAARERDLPPLLEECRAILDFSYEQCEAMEDFLGLAWISGTRSARDQLRAGATGSKAKVQAAAISRFETEFRALMEESADAFNLTLVQTVTMWHYLQQAWVAGNRTCEAEIVALIVESQYDVAAEAQEWLEEADASG